VPAAVALRAELISGAPIGVHSWLWVVGILANKAGTQLLVPAAPEKRPGWLPVPGHPAGIATRAGRLPELAISSAPANSLSPGAAGHSLAQVSRQSPASAARPARWLWSWLGRCYLLRQLLAGGANSANGELTGENGPVPGESERGLREEEMAQSTTPAALELLLRLGPLRFWLRVVSASHRCGGRGKRVPGPGHYTLTDQSGH